MWTIPYPAGARSAAGGRALTVEVITTAPAEPAPGAPRLPCALVTGSGALVPPELSSTVSVVDLPVRIGDQEINARSDEELHLFYAQLRDGATPETSTSPPGEFLEAFRRSPAERILCLTIPAGWRRDGRQRPAGGPDARRRRRDGSASPSSTPAPPPPASG